MKWERRKSGDYILKVDDIKYVIYKRPSGRITKADGYNVKVFGGSDSLKIIFSAHTIKECKEFVAGLISK